MHAKDFFINDSCNWKTVEAIGKGFPQFDIVSTLAFIIKAIDSINGSALVVASEKEEIFRVFNLIGQ